MDPTLIAHVRALVGDTNAQWFTDDEVSAFLTVTNNNALRAAGTALQNMAVNFAVQGRSIKTDDLAIDTRTRATALVELAKQFFAQADDIDKQAAADIFEIAPTVAASSNPYYLPIPPTAPIAWPGIFV